MSYRKLSELVNIVDIKNTDCKVTRVIGVSISKNFIPSIANLNGVDLTKYNLIKKNQFACKLMSVGRDLQLPIDLYKEDDLALISSAYYVFEVKDENEVVPDYLNMWFRRKETDRWVGYISGGDVRGGISWDMFLEMDVNVPSIEKQRELVAEYQAVANKIKVNEQICEKLEATAQALYKHWFVDFEFPNDNGQPYKSSGGNMVFNDELEKEIPEGWEVGKLENIIYYSNTKVSLKDLTSQNYISTESMLTDKKGVDFISNVPDGNNVSEFNEGDILISNIRPYLKKIWFADINGGCSNDVLCLRSKEPVFQFFALNILFNDQFFDYVMQGAKGTKMPRGDKDWILDYKILLPTVSALDLFSKEILLVNKVKKLKTKQNQKLIQLQSLLLSRLATLEGETTKN